MAESRITGLPLRVSTPTVITNALRPAVPHITRSRTARLVADLTLGDYLRQTVRRGRPLLLLA
jgi:hypothetical protein